MKRKVFRVSYGSRTGEKHADFPTLDAAKSLASEVFTKTGVVVAIVEVEVK